MAATLRSSFYTYRNLVVPVKIDLTGCAILQSSIKLHIYERTREIPPNAVGKAMVYIQMGEGVYLRPAAIARATHCGLLIPTGRHQNCQRVRR